MVLIPQLARSQNRQAAKALKILLVQAVSSTNFSWFSQPRRFSWKATMARPEKGQSQRGHHLNSTTENPYQTAGSQGYDQSEVVLRALPLHKQALM
jgi:hypothetical protein